MTESEHRDADRAEKRQDRRQKERSDDRSAKVNFFGHAIKGLASVAKLNDLKWYTKLLGASEVNASIPDFQPIGLEDSVLQKSGDYRFVGVPAVIALNYGPTLGNIRESKLGPDVLSTAAGTDPVNRALNRVATQLEQRNSRVLSYSRDTIGRYIFIATDIVTRILRIKLALDVYDMSDANHPYLGRQIIRALGFKYPDFKANISAYRSIYVTIANDFNAGIPLPGDLSYVQRNVWLSNTIVKDMASEHASYLVFNRCINYSLGFSNGDSSDVYVAHSFEPDGHTFANYTTTLRQLMSAFINGATWKPLIRDIRGGIKSTTWLKIPEEVTVKTAVFTDEQEVRAQLQNIAAIPFIGIPNSSYHIKGLVYSAFSVGGTNSESVIQNGLVGLHLPSGNPNTALEARFSQMMPGTVLFDCGSVSNSTLFKNYYDHAHMDNVDWAPGSTYVGAQPLSLLGKRGAEDVLVSTRLKANYACKQLSVSSWTAGEGPYYYTAESGNESISAAVYLTAVMPVQYGTEIIVGMTMFKDVDDTVNLNGINQMVTAERYFSVNSTVFDSSDNYIVTTTDYTFVETWLGTNFPCFAAMILALGTLSTVDWFPLTRFAYSGMDSPYINAPVSHRYVGELDHYTIIDASVLGKLHQQCLESEFTLDPSSYLAPLS